MQIFVKTLVGKSISIKVESDNTIEDLKKKIQNQTKMSSNRQRLIFGGKQLENYRTISSYRIKNGFTVHLVFRISGGGK